MWDGKHCCTEKVRTKTTNPFMKFLFLEGWNHKELWVPACRDGSERRDGGNLTTDR